MSTNKEKIKRKLAFTRFAIKQTIADLRESYKKERNSSDEGESYYIRVRGVYVNVVGRKSEPVLTEGLLVEGVTVEPTKDLSEAKLLSKEMAGAICFLLSAAQEIPLDQIKVVAASEERVAKNKEAIRILLAARKRIQGQLFENK